MRHGFRKGMALLLAGILSLTLIGASLADTSGAIGGDTSAAAAFDVTCTGSGSGYVKLSGAKGSAYVAEYDYYGNLTGYKSEAAYGFYQVQVTKSDYSQSYIWAASATESGTGADTSQSLVIVFPGQGTYRVTVTPLAQGDINGTYWPKDRFQSWTKPATWVITKEVNCKSGNASGGGSVQPQPQPQPQPGSATVTVYCYDIAGIFLRSYTETVTASKTIQPQDISGYTPVTSGRYITYSNGVCSPDSVTFRYQKAQASGTVTVYCYDTAGNYLRAYTETITGSRMVYPQDISGYSTPSGGQYVTLTNGACNPSTVTFRYQKAQAYGTVTVYCYDTAGNYIRAYTETVTNSRMIYPQAVTGYSTPSGGQYITYNNGICNPSTVTFRYEKTPTSAQLTLNCYDTSGAYIRSFIQTVTGNTTVYPPNITGYRAVSGGQNITFSNGTVSPGTVNFQYEPYSTSATLTVNCYDIAGIFLDSYTETITSSRTVNPRELSGYRIASGGQYVTFSNGTCVPAAVTFRYQKIANPATLNVDCYDTAGNYIRSYTETITASRTVTPQAISGYNIVSGGEAVTYSSDGTCSPAKVTFTYEKIPTPAAVTIRCIDNNGNVIRSYTETVTADRTISPPAIAGYTALSPAQQVTFSDGTCSPAQIDFQYQVGTPVPPGGNPEVAYPAYWDTQFKPGTASKDHDNDRQIQFLPYICDDNPATSFSWIWWSSESDLTKDNIPELTAYFEGETVSSIGIRNGNMTGGSSSYKKYARAKRFFVKIYDTSENMMTEFTMNIPDQYSTDYRIFPLGATYTNVSRIEFWIAGYYNGDSSKHNIHVSDIIFYK